MCLLAKKHERELLTKELKTLISYQKAKSTMGSVSDRVIHDFWPSNAFVPQLYTEKFKHEYLPSCSELCFRHYTIMKFLRV